MNNAVTAAAAGAYVLDGKPIDAKTLAAQGISAAQLDNAYKGTMAYAVLSAHNTLPVTEKGAPLKIKFDAMASHDITYVGIIQNAKASGLEKFPLPYVLTNCHRGRPRVRSVCGKALRRHFRAPSSGGHTHLYA